MFGEEINEFHDDMLRDVLKDLTVSQLEEMLQACIADENYEHADVVKKELASRAL